MPKAEAHPTQQLAIDLEKATLTALRRSFSDLNATFFSGRLRRPVLMVSHSDNRLGRWDRVARTLQISWRLLVEQSWGVVLEVLKHEMAHQYVDEVLGCEDETAHGPAFRRICQERGIDARAAGIPRAGPTDDPRGRVLQRVAKLLALAESSDLHEAQAAALAAQRLMLKYNIDSVAQARRHSYGFRHLGRAKARTTESERILASIIDEHFFVEAVWVPVWRPLEGKRGNVLEVCGSPENLEFAEYAHSFLSRTAERLWREYKRARRWRKNKNRQSYLAGVMAGFRSQLLSQQRVHQQRGLVWLGDSELSRYFRQRHPHIRRTKHVGRYHAEAYADGRQAGARIVLHRPVERGPSEERRLLPGRQ